ncbi:hypothetical protein BOX15_Mlig018463g1, partial [Macrostomum lignano]
KADSMASVVHSDEAVSIEQNTSNVNSGKQSKLPSDSRIELGDITQHNIRQLRIINQVVFPVSYTDKFYDDILENGELGRLAYFNDIVVGAVCCRIQSEAGQRRLYIMTLGCLAPYRELGVGTKLLEYVFEICSRDKNIDNIFLHVQTSNEGALAFYKKFGFEIVDTAYNYYKRIVPPDAYVLQKNLVRS